MLFEKSETLEEFATARAKYHQYGDPKLQRKRGNTSSPTPEQRAHARQLDREKRRRQKERDPERLAERERVKARRRYDRLKAEEPEKLREINRRKHQKKQEQIEFLRQCRFSPAKSPCESRLVILRNDQIFAVVDEALPKGMDPDVRDDIRSSLVLACLEHSLAPEDMKQRAAEYVTAYWRERPEFRFRSLDAPTFDDGGGTLHDVVSTTIWEATL